MQYSVRKQSLRRLQTRAEIIFYRSSETKKTFWKRLKRHFETPLFFPEPWHAPPDPGHGRIDQRSIALLPAQALSKSMRAAWPSLRTIACVTRKRDHVRAGRIMKTEVETTYLINQPRCAASRDPFCASTARIGTSRSCTATRMSALVKMATQTAKTTPREMSSR